MSKLTRKEELTYRFDVKQIAKQVKEESNKLKREAKRAALKEKLTEWYYKKYPQPKEL